MESTDFLLELAEIATAFAGFSGVVAAMGNTEDWSLKERFRFENLLMISVSVVFLSLLPLVIEFYGIGDVLRWRIANVLLAAFTIAFLLLRAPIARKFVASDPDDRVTKIVAFIFASFNSTVLVLQIVGLTYVGTSKAVFLSGLLVMLFLSAIQFILLSLHSLTSRSK